MVCVWLTTSTPQFTYWRFIMMAFSTPKVLCDFELLPQLMDTDMGAVWLLSRRPAGDAARLLRIARASHEASRDDPRA